MLHQFMGSKDPKQSRQSSASSQFDNMVGLCFSFEAAFGSYHWFYPSLPYSSTYILKRRYFPLQHKSYWFWVVTDKLHYKFFGDCEFDRTSPPKSLAWVWPLLMMMKLVAGQRSWLAYQSARLESAKWNVSILGRLPGLRQTKGNDKKSAKQF